MKRNLGPVDQFVYVVDDLEAAARHWAARGAGPFFRYTPNVRYVGPDPQIATEIATGSYGAVMVKLMVPVPGGFLPSEPGLHSLAITVEDLDEACATFERQGHTTVLRAETTQGHRFAFVDAGVECGHLWELVEASDGMRTYYASLAAAADGWDGRDPIRA